MRPEAPEGRHGLGTAKSTLEVLMGRKHRLNLIISGRAWERLDWLKDRTDAASHTEVIRQALFAYEQLVCKILDGSKLMEKTAKGELTTLPLSIDVKTPPAAELQLAS